MNVIIRPVAALQTHERRKYYIVKEYTLTKIIAVELWIKPQLQKLTRFKTLESLTENIIDTHSI